MKKILLIDDENSIARLVGSMAGDAGYAFAYAEDGAEGLVVAEREAPDLVIMDV
ncbi:MAG: response regulator, partial [Gordonibacter urolithinfaciens]